MNIDDMNEKNVTAFIVGDMEDFKRYFDKITPKSLRSVQPQPTLLGIRVRVSRNIPPNKVAVCDKTGIIGFFDMEPEPPEMA